MRKCERAKGHRYENLDGLRGICAITVAVGHAFYFSSEKSPHPSAVIMAISSTAADIAVLFFFVLSGFVIGATTNEPFDKAAVLLYAVKRILRIYPIYVFALTLGFLAQGRSVLSTEFVGDLAFLQMWVFGYPPGNGPLWSLHYEVVFYIAFIAIWMFCVNLRWLLISLFLISLILFFTNIHLLVCVCYFALWVQGLWLSRQQGTQQDIKFPLIAMVVILFAFFSGNVWSIVVSKIAPPVFASFNLPHPLTALAASWAITSVVGSLVGLQIKYAKAYIGLIASLTSLSIGYAYRAGLLSKMPNYQIACAALLIGAIATIFWQRPSMTWRYSKFLGDISYALYAVHSPIMSLALTFAVGMHWPLWKITLLALLSLIPSGFIAFALERVIQPRLTQFARNRTSSLPWSRKAAPVFSVTMPAQH